MRGTGSQVESGTKDSLLRAIAELREQVDRLIEEQKAAVTGYLARLADETNAAERAVAPADPVAEASTGRPSTDAFSKAKRPAAPERLPNATPPPPPRAAVAVANGEGTANGRADDPRERLDALAKHLDRKLRQAANGAAVEAPPRTPD